MKIYKKTLSFFLSLMLVIGTFTAIPAFAAEETKSSDATLSALTYKVGDDGTATDVAGFGSSTETYNVELPSGTDKSAKITLEGTVTDTDKAKVTKNDGVTLADGQGTATITVTAEDETTKTYTVNFTIKVEETKSSDATSDSGSNSGSNSGSSSHHSNNSSGSSSSSGKSSASSSTPSSSGAASTSFSSDTTGDFSVKGSYQFKITSKDGKSPVFTVGTPGVFKVELASSSGNDYYFKLIAIGAPGAQAGIYVNGQKLLVATVGAQASDGGVKSDTTAPFKVKAGKDYTFKLTAKSKPSFVCGNGSVFTVTFAGQKGSDYFFKAKAVGKAGSCAGFYINGSKTPCTTATVA